MQSKNIAGLVLALSVLAGCTNVRSTSHSSDVSASANYEASTPSESGELAIGTSDFLLKGIAYIAMLSVIIPLSN
jgi:hypothetical protein